MNLKWPRIALDDLTEKDRRITYGVVKPGEAMEGGVAFVRGGDLLQGRLAIDQLRTITPQLSQVYKRTLLRGGELLISLVGNPGEVAIAPPALQGANIARQVGLIALSAEHDARFIMYFLMSPLGRAELFSRTGGAVQQVINLADLKTLKVPVPPKKEQTRIASILSAYDDLIENNRRRMVLLEESARLLYREWFVRLRFPGHESTRIVNGVPQGWAFNYLSEIADVNRSSLRSCFDGEIEYIDIASVNTGAINETTRFEIREAPSRARRIVRHGDIIWSCVRPNRRSHAVIWNPPANMIASTGFAVITPIAVPPSFLYHASTTDDFVGYLENHAKGATYPAVGAKDFERSSIMVPAKRVIDGFDDVVEPIFFQLHTLRLQNQKLRAARDLLLPKLMSGEIAV